MKNTTRENYALVEEQNGKGWGYAFKLVIATIVSIIIFILWSTFVLSIGVAIG